MTKTGIIALLIVIAAIFTIGVVGFILIEVTPGPTIQENVASPTTVATPLPANALPGEKTRLQLPSRSDRDGGQATPSAQELLNNGNMF